MPTINRRRFLQQSSLLAAATFLPGCSDSSDNRSSGTAIVIGSGFAGSVAALRLAQAGIRTTVLERGRQWTVEGPDTFPTTTGFDRRSSWTIPPSGAAGGGPAFAGLLETIPGDVTVQCGACVGGGSLVYGGVLFQPPRATFETVFSDLMSYDEMAAIYYPRVIEQIGAAPIPDDVLASPTYTAHRTFIADAEGAGFEVVKPDTSFDWDIIRREIAGEIPAAASVSDYAFGCNSDCKLSTDKNYLRDAVASGNCELRSLTEVEVIRELAPRGYALVCRNITEEGELVARFELRADFVFLAAGSMNTSKLLLKSQQAGELRGANDRVGQRWGTNGDELLAQFHPGPVPGPQGGPASIAAIDWTNADNPVAFMHSPIPFDIQLQLAMSVPDALGNLSYDAARDALGIHWPADGGTPSGMARAASFRRLLGQNGGSQAPFISGTIWHPLGGAVMNDASDSLGRLYGYKNLFVIDGATLPGSAGAVNPALTVAANAERILEALIPQLRA